MVRAVQILLLVFAFPALAEEYVVTNRLNLPLTLHVIEKQECLARIAELTNAEGTIAQAIAALTGRHPDTPLACLEDLAINRQEISALVPVPAVAPEFGVPAAYPYEKVTKLGVLQARANCANLYAEGSTKSEEFKRQNASLCLVWYAGDEAKTVKAEAAAAQAAMAKWLSESSDRYRMAAAVSALIVPPPPSHDRRSEELSARLECYNQNEPGTADYKKFAKRYEKKCAGKWQNKEERELVGAELRALGEKDSAARAAWGENAAAGIAYVQQEILAGRVDQARLAAMSAKTACFNRKDAGTKAYEYESRRLADTCPNGFTSAAELEALAAEAQKLFPNFAAESALARKKYAEAKAAFPAIRARALRKKSAAYEDARFLVKLTHFLGHGGSLDRAGQFCADYEMRQHDDAQLAKSGVEMFPFELPRDWRNALTYGLTEGEFSSIRAYTRNFYQEINGAMRAGLPLPPKLVHFRKVFDRALGQLPDYNATSVNRVDHFPAEVLKQYQEGNILRYDAYTSTSKAKDWLNNGKVDHKSVIYLAHGGKNIEDFSHYTDEEEILIRPGTRFKVLKKTTYPGAAAMFILGEVDEQGKLLAGPAPEEK